MSAHSFPEDQLVEQPAIGLFAQIDWQTLVARRKSLVMGGETSGEVVVVRRFHALTLHAFTNFTHSCEV
jgi:type I restriction enzyme R subunit